MVPTWKASTGQVPLDTWSLSGLQLLVVTNQNPNPTAMIELFEQGGARVTPYSSARAVLELESEALEQFDLLVCAMNMPGMSGHSLHARLTTRGVQLPVVFRTGVQQQAFLGSNAFVLRDSVGPGVLLQVCAFMAGAPPSRST